VTFDVVCAGVIYLDLTFAGLDALPRAGEERWAPQLELSPGGMANTAVALSRLGLRTAVVGAIGEDLVGRYLRTMLEAEGVACRGPVTSHSAVTAVLPIDGDRALVSHLPPEVAAADFSIEHPRALVVLVDQLVHAPPGTRVYVITSHADITAAAQGASLHLDGRRAIIANEVEALALTHQSDVESAARVLSRRVETAIVTLGREGALAVSGGEVVREPAATTRVRHTTGAGDLFAAAYVWADLAGFELRDRLRWASIYASRSLRTLTAFAGAVTLADLTAAAREHGLT
jgi:sugar/nucleoside kinase (ribokinase family)